jgi:hypothetical protein
MSGAHCERFPACMHFSEMPRMPQCELDDCPGKPRLYKLGPFTTEEDAYLEGLLKVMPPYDPSQIIGGMRKLMEDQDPPIAWLVSALRDLARELVADPKRQWLGERDPTKHICWTAADRLEAIARTLPLTSGYQRDEV